YKGLANMGAWFVGRLQTEQDRARLRDGLLDTGMEAAALDRLLDATEKRRFLLHDVHRKAPVLMESRWAMSYLRGPLTRAEVARLPAAEKPVASRPSAIDSAKTASPSAALSLPPIPPPPFKNYFLSLHDGAIAEAHLLVKAAVRFKGGTERVLTRAWPLG